MIHNIARPILIHVCIGMPFSLFCATAHNVPQPTQNERANSKEPSTTCDHQQSALIVITLFSS